MNNLKRILSLALASVMVLGMMVVGASATDYPDDDKIVNKSAVDTLAALGIMNGDEQGFRPEDGLTRAEAAKMLAKIHNKGRDVNYGTKTTPTFNDIKGHWAESNIEYAAAFGIVNGKGNGIFDPQGQLRMVELVRMTLNMMGYDEGKTGSDWELQTTVLADDLGLFDGLESFDPTAKVIRDDAAQILVNSIYTPMANGTTTQSTIYTVEVTKAGASTEEKSLEAFEFDSVTDAVLVASTYGLDAGEYKVNKETNSSTETLGTKYLALQTISTGVIANVSDDGKGTYTVTMSNGASYTKVATDYSDLMGQRVTVLCKSTSNVYGMNATGSVVYEGTVGGYSAIYAAMAPSTTQATIGNATIYEYNKFAATHGTIASNSLSPEQELKVVRNGNSFVAVTTPKTLSEVTNVTTKTATVKGMAALKIDEEIALNGAVKGDIVLVTAAANTVSGMVELEKAEIMENVAADAYRGTNQVRINGQWLTVLKNDDFNVLKAMAKNTTYDLVMVNGYIAAQEVSVAAAEAKDLLVLTKVASAATGGLNSYWEAQAYFVKDGSTAVIKLAADTTTKDPNKLYTYSEKNGIYTLTAMSNNDGAVVGCTAGIDATGGVTTGNKIGSTLIDENAQIIVVLKDGKVEVVNGKTARGWDLDVAFGGTNALAYTKAVNGVPYVQFAFLTATSNEALPNAGATGKDYGYIVSTPYTTSKGTVYTIWTGTEEKEVTDTGDASLSKGDFIEYKTGDGVIVATKLTADIDAVRGWNTADKVIKLHVKGDKVIDDKTVYIYIDSESTKGQPAVDLALASEDEDAPGRYIANVKVVMGTGSNADHVDILIVDVQNDMGVQAKTSDDTKFDAVKAALIAKKNTVITADTLVTSADEAAVKAVLQSINGLGNETLANVVIVRFTGTSGKQYKLDIKSESATTPEITTTMTLTTTEGIFYFDKTAQTELASGTEYTITVTEVGGSAVTLTGNTFTA